MASKVRYICQNWLRSINFFSSQGRVLNPKWLLQIKDAKLSDASGIPTLAETTEFPRASERASERGGEERGRSIEGLDIAGLKMTSLHIYIYIDTHKCVCVFWPLFDTEFRVGHEDIGHGFGASTDEQYCGLPPQTKSSKFAASSEWLIQEVEVYYCGRLSTSPAVTKFHWESFFFSDFDRHKRRASEWTFDLNVYKTRQVAGLYCIPETGRPRKRTAGPCKLRRWIDTRVELDFGKATWEELIHHRGR